MNIFKLCWRRMLGNPDEFVAKSALTPLTQTALRRGHLARKSSLELSDVEFWRIIGLTGAPPSPPTLSTNAPRRSSVVDFVYQTSVVLAFQDLPAIFKPRTQVTLPKAIPSRDQVDPTRPVTATA
ncbi:hypothetical protein SDRG_08669 [Saprolegnia diclina VS20]|uniref:Uncharacterized protein n=1 Tax=Saprolegnia diclina (strain VS20) TaxID=1156394 RepID=T0QJS7_SAPDV|nr:hypothetical protein SDRG_08669 [Saprolegnia diclina VS20]EQC33990.1 hypothetical protein SDRG_08669 [Saprolegnia diclina VS20]|eukprot:XP_008612785.1 hypothetical protein SDRG_08669 [Saprolegnia diclina VS20]